MMFNNVGSVGSSFANFRMPNSISPSDLATTIRVLEQLQQSGFSNASSTNPLNRQSPLAQRLPNPQQLGFLLGVALIEAALAQLPSLGQRLSTIGSQAGGPLQNAVNQMGGGGGSSAPVQTSQASTGAPAPAVSDSGGGGGGGSITSFGGPSDAVSQAASAGAFSDAPSSDEQKMLDQIKDPAEKARMQLQLKLQKQAEIASMISNILNIKHQTAMSTIQNIR